MKWKYTQENSPSITILLVWNKKTLRRFRRVFYCRNVEGDFMKESSVFDVLGPIMVGPSSSHTAGAVRLGLMAGKILGTTVREATIILHGSFAETGKGHGTHLALSAGLLGLQPDDERIRQAKQIAQEMGVKIEFKSENLGDIHPNTAKFFLKGINGKTIETMGSSIGGGRIVVREINQFKVEFMGDYSTLIVLYTDYPGMVAEITSILAESFINIAQMKVSREGKGGRALAVIETDQFIGEDVISAVGKLPLIEQVMFIEPLN